METVLKNPAAEQILGTVLSNHQHVAYFDLYSLFVFIYIPIIPYAAEGGLG